VGEEGAAPLTGLKRRKTQRSRRSSHDPNPRGPHPGTAQRKPR
jgi:hypothetical protein